MSLIYAYSQVSKPKGLALSLDEVKNFLRIDHDIDDAFLNSAIRSATTKFENYTGRALVNQEWQVTFKQMNVASITLPIRPVQDITKIELINYYGQSSSFELQNVCLDMDLGEVFFKVHPFSYLVKFVYQAGYGATSDDIPADIKTSLLVHVAFIYEHRDEIKAFPMDIYDEFKSYRV